MLTEVSACTGPPRRTCRGIDVAPQVAWRQLVAALGPRAGMLRFASDIGYLPNRGKVRGPLAPIGGPAGATGLGVALVVLGAAVTVWAVQRRRARLGGGAPGGPRKRRRPRKRGRGGRARGR